MTPSEKQALRALCEKATPGPWSVKWCDDEPMSQTRRCDFIVAPLPADEKHWDGPPFNKDVVVADSGVYPPHGYDAAFIAAARSAVPELLDECERKDFVLAGIQERFDAQCSELAALKAECERLREELDHATAHDGDHLSKRSRAMCNTVLLERDALRSENESLKSALKLAGTSATDAYQHRSEHQRLLHSDVAQGKRIAELLAENESLKARLNPTIEQHDANPARYWAERELKVDANGARVPTLADCDWPKKHLRDALAENESLKAALREACDIAERHVRALDSVFEGKAQRVTDDAARLASLRQKAGG